MKKQVVFGVAAVVLCLSVILAAVFMKTAALPDSFDRLVGESGKTQFLDSSGEILNASYQSYWNVHDRLKLYEIPPLLVKMFVFSEDKNFYEHSGVDFLAKAARWGLSEERRSALPCAWAANKMRRGEAKNVPKKR